MAAAANLIYVRISVLLGKVINSKRPKYSPRQPRFNTTPAVYDVRHQSSAAFVENTEMVVRGMAELAGEINSFVDGCFGQISRVASSLSLAYHQVIARHSFQSTYSRHTPNTDYYSVSFSAVAQSYTIFLNDTWIPMKIPKPYRCPHLQRALFRCA